MTRRDVLYRCTYAVYTVDHKIIALHICKRRQKYYANNRIVFQNDNDILRVRFRNISDISKIITQW